MLSLPHGTNTASERTKNFFSIRYKLMIAFGLLTVAASAVLVFSSVYTARNLTMKKVAEHLKDKAIDTAQIIDASFKQQTYYLETIGRILLKEPDLSWVEKAAVLEEEAKDHPELKGIYIYDTEGWLHLANGERYYSGDNKDVQKALAGNIAILEPYKDRVENIIVVSVLIPIFDRSKKVSGMLCADFDGLILNDYIKNIVVGQSGISYILSEDGTTIAYKETKYVLEQYNTIKKAEKDPSLAVLPLLKKEQ